MCNGRTNATKACNQLKAFSSNHSRRDATPRAKHRHLQAGCAKVSGVLFGRLKCLFAWAMLASVDLHSCADLNSRIQLRKGDYALSSYWHEQPVTLPTNSTVKGCIDGSCALDFNWQTASLVAPNGSRISFSNIHLYNVTFWPKVDRDDAVQYLLHETAFLPAALFLQTGAFAFFQNVTMQTTCSEVASLNDRLYESQLNFWKFLENAPPEDQRLQLVWDNNIEVLPGYIRISLLSTNFSNFENVAITCQPTLQTANSMTNGEASLVVQPVWSSNELRTSIEQLSSVVTKSLVLVIKATMSLEVGGAWSLASGPCALPANVVTTFLGPTSLDVAIDYCNRNNVWLLSNNVVFVVQNLVMTNLPIGPPHYAPYNLFSNFLWGNVPFTNRVTSMFGEQGGNWSSITRNCIIEDVLDPYLYTAVWGGLVLAPIGVKNEATFLYRLFDKANVTTVGSPGRDGFGAVCYMFVSGNIRVDMLTVRMGSSRRFPMLPTLASNLGELTNNMAVPLDCIATARDCEGFYEGVSSLVALLKTDVALWVMQPMKLDAPLVSNLSSGASHRLLIVGYAGSEALDLDFQINPLPSAPSRQLVVSSLVILNVPVLGERDGQAWDLLGVSLWPLRMADIALKCRHVVVVVSPDEVKFLREWAPKLLSLNASRAPDNNTLVYQSLRAFGYNGVNITVTCTCPENATCRSTGVTYEQLVGVLVQGTTNQAALNGPVNGSYEVGSPATSPWIQPAADGSSNLSTSTSPSSSKANQAVVVGLAVGIPAAVLLVAAGLFVLHRKYRGGVAKPSLLWPARHSSESQSYKSSPASEGRALQAASQVVRNVGDASGAAGDGNVLSTANLDFTTLVIEMTMSNPNSNNLMIDKLANLPDLVRSNTAASKVMNYPGGTMALVLDTVSKLTNIQDDTIVLKELLGRGGSSAVYAGLWRGLEVAVKVQLVPGGDAAMLGRVAQEVATMFRLQHRHVVAVYSYQARPVASDLNHPGPAAFYSRAVTMSDESTSVVSPRSHIDADIRVSIVQERCSAGTLLAAVDRGVLCDAQQPGVLTPLAAQLAVQVADAMAYVHSQGLVHGDLNPRNVLLHNPASGGVGALEAKVADFGLAVTLGAGQTHVTRSCQGTPCYIAPEVFTAAVTSRPADVYAFGIILWELSHGTPPWRRTPVASLDVADDVFAAPPVPQIQPSCPAWLCSLITACTELDPSARPSFVEVLATLRAAAADPCSAALQQLAPASPARSGV